MGDGEGKITRHSLIYTDLTRIIERPVGWAILMPTGTQQFPLCDPEHNLGVRTDMPFGQLRHDLTRTMNRRRLYARIRALPQGTVREELLAIAQRHDANG